MVTPLALNVAENQGHHEQYFEVHRCPGEYGSEYVLKILFFSSGQSNEAFSTQSMLVEGLIENLTSIVCQQIADVQLEGKLKQHSRVSFA